MKDVMIKINNYNLGKHSTIFHLTWEVGRMSVFQNYSCMLEYVDIVVVVRIS